MRKSHYFHYGQLLAGSLLCVAAGNAWAKDNLKMRLDFSPWGMHAAVHLAEQKGWFSEADLDVDVQDGTGSIATLQLLASDQFDVGQVSVGTMAVAKENGLDLISIAGFARTGDLAVITAEDKQITTPQDLKGSKIVCFTTSPWAPFIDPYLSRNGLSRKDVNVVMVAPTAMVSTYVSGNGDGIMTQAPFGTPMVAKTRPATALLMEDSGLRFPSYGLVTSPQSLETKKDALKRFVEVQVKAWEYIYDGHEEEAVDAIMARRPNARLDRDVLRGQIDAYKDFFQSPTVANAPIGVQYDADWEAAIASMHEAGLVAADRKPSDYYTNVLFE